MSLSIQEPATWRYDIDAVSGRSRATYPGVVSAMSVVSQGAKGDGVTDDTAAVRAAFNAAANGGVVYFPAGTYVLTGTITQTVTGAVTVRGDGPGVSVLNCASNGLAIAMGSQMRATVADLSIVSTAAAVANTGLAITSTDQTSSVHLANLVVRGNTAQTTSWQTGISITGPGVPTMDTVTVLMPNGPGTGGPGPTGIFYAGAGASQPSSNFRLSNSFIQGGLYGVQMGSYTEGVLLTNDVIIGGDYSVYWPHTAGAANMLEIGNCHLNPGLCGVYAQQVGFISIVSTFILRFGGANWTGIDLEACNNVAISANNIYGTGVGTENGILVNNSAGAPVAITGNGFLQLGTSAIALAGNTAAATITGNNAGSMPGGSVLVNDTSGTTTNQALGNSFNGVFDLTVRAGTLRFGTMPTNAANDAAAASAGVGVGGVYRNGSVLQVRVT